MNTLVTVISSIAIVLSVLVRWLRDRYSMLHYLDKPEIFRGPVSALFFSVGIWSLAIVGIAGLTWARGWWLGAAALTIYLLVRKATFAFWYDQAYKLYYPHTIQALQDLYREREGREPDDAAIAFMHVDARRLTSERIQRNVSGIVD